LPVGIAAMAQEPGGAAQPPWRLHPIPWVAHNGQPRPWRSDSRLAAFMEEGYPDDVRVMFGPADSLKQQVPESMWVTITAYDSSSDLFLGILINQPFYLPGINNGDNVVFRVDDQFPRLVAVAVNGSYADAAWPPSDAPQFSAMLRDGVRAYRLGNNGHNPPEIERCISILTPLVDSVPSSASRDERFVGHFVLGRCLAEVYQTERALDQFHEAIQLDSSDLDSHMAFLAELSVMTHTLPGELTPHDEARWERAFLDELALVRARFADDPAVQKMLGMVFDPKGEATLAPAWRPYVAKLRRVGYGVFRWKRR
jgi:hypothetical protein